MAQIKILILEDVKLDAELTERELKSSKLDYISKRVEEESDFRRALEEFKPDLILADHSLPHFDGVSALKIVKESSPDTMFIFVSGKIGEEFAVEMLKDGATDYVLKSNLPKLGHAVKRALNEHNKKIKLRNAQNALLESENKYRTLFEKNNNPIIVFDNEGNFMESNEAALNFMETKPDQLLESNLADFIFNDQEIEGENTQFWKEGDVSEVKFMIKGKIKVMEITVTHVDLKDKNIVFGVGKDITERKKAEIEILSSLEEKELLLREIHHRVKNNLQIISTLLTLQSSKSKNDDVDDLYKESQRRIQSIALIHENLYHSEYLAHINFAEYTKGLVTDIFDSYGIDSNVVGLNMDIDDVVMGIETAVPCGLIINELVSNSLKHGFPNKNGGEVNIELNKIDDSEYSLIVSDNGLPFPEGVDLLTSDTLGLELIRNLVKQLDSELTLDMDTKEYKIIFRELEYKERI